MDKQAVFERQKAKTIQSVNVHHPNLDSATKSALQNAKDGKTLNDIIFNLGGAPRKPKF